MKGAASRIALAALLLAGAGCTLERRVRDTGGIESALRHAGKQGSAWDGLLDAGRERAAPPLTDEEAASLRQVDEQGVVTLISRSPGDVMYHLARTLREKEYELLLEQVLSDATKTEYRKRAMDPMEAVHFLAAHEKDILALLAAMPLGDQTPGAIFETIGPNRFRVSPPPSIAGDLKLRRFEVIIEDRRFRLLMIH